VRARVINAKETEEGRKKEVRAGTSNVDALFIEKSFNLADQEESGGSAAMQGKESPVGSNTQETHQYVGPYRLEKTLGKGQTGKWGPSLFSSYSYSYSYSRSH
jgi:hypothetical protein